MHKNIKKIQKFEQRPFIIKNFINQRDIEIFQKIYDELPVEINNTRQQI